MGGKLFLKKVIYCLYPCNGNPLIPFLEVHRINLIRRGNFVVFQKHLQFFYSSFELVSTHFSGLLFWVSLFYSTLTGMLDVLMFTFVKQFLKPNKQMQLISSNVMLLSRKEHEVSNVV